MEVVFRAVLSGRLKIISMRAEGAEKVGWTTQCGSVGGKSKTFCIKEARELGLIGFSNRLCMTHDCPDRSGVACVSKSTLVVF